MELSKGSTRVIADIIDLNRERKNVCKIFGLAFALGLLIIVQAGFSGSKPSTNNNANAVSLRGMVTGFNKEIPAKASTVTVTVKFKLEFVNTGVQPFILLSEKCPICPGVTLTKTPGPAVGDNILFDEYYGPSVSTAPEWKEFRANLNQSKPPTGLVQIVKPGDSWVMESVAVLRPPKKLERYRIDRPPVSWEVLIQSSPVWLRLNCEVWPFNVENNPLSGKLHFGHELQKRWRQYGMLQLGPIVSEPIKLNLQD